MWKIEFIIFIIYWYDLFYDISSGNVDVIDI